MRFERQPQEFFPSVAQAKLLLRSGAHGAMTRILTLIGITEGFGNDGIRALPFVDFQSHFVESIEGTALAHLHGGLLEAHGADEAGRSDEQDARTKPGTTSCGTRSATPRSTTRK